MIPHPFYTSYVTMKSMLVHYKSRISEVHLKNILDSFYNEFNFKERLKHDPIEFPRRFSNPEDAEVAGILASCFAYGKVELFKPVIEKILKPGGTRPARFFLDFSLQKDSNYFKGINYRFNKEKDVLCLIYIVSQALKRWGSLKNLFSYYYRPEQRDIGQALGNFLDFLLSIDTSPVYGKNIKPYGLTQFFPIPQKGSTCKRINLFLRWMVRTKDIDLGIWNNIEPSKLIIPLDTHIVKISRCLGLTKRASTDWKAAQEITESLRKLDHEDPLKYDFALCHLGISGLCRGKESLHSCSICVINPSPFFSC
ncbi:MAG: TIGR02757 family protein [Thermodesulfovibrionia bacterium]|nr:TIGR02757 family protein [Thermodesulfovibrionia bacterium]